MGGSAQAGTLPFPVSLDREVVSETAPTAFAPAPLAASDFVIQWLGPPIPGVRVELSPRKIQWVRIADVLVLPRGVLRVDVQGAEAGLVRVAGTAQPLLRDKAGAAFLEMPVPLLDGAKHPIDLVLRRGGVEVKGRLVLRFTARNAPGKDRVFFDPSCSRHGVKGALPSSGDRWMYVGCRLIHAQGFAHATNLLELWIYAAGTDALFVDNFALLEVAPSLTVLTLSASPGAVTITPDRGPGLTIVYRIPPQFQRLTLGMGVGPYLHRFQIGPSIEETWTALQTLYGSVSITDGLRVVLFGATAFERRISTDMGLYLHIEWFRFMDRRITAHLLLGGHVFGFRDLMKDRFRVRFTAPQGVEFIATDVGFRGFNVTSGAFVYPRVKSQSYYDLWLRYGTARVFVEANYIQIGDVIDGLPLDTRSVGLTIGFPFLRMF